MIDCPSRKARETPKRVVCGLRIQFVIQALIMLAALERMLPVPYPK
jgi:hypothetical protein